VARPATANQLI